MNTERGTVADADAGTRLDAWLALNTTASSRGRASKALASGKVSVDGVPMDGGDGGRVLAAGSVVQLVWGQPGTGRSHAGAKGRMVRSGVELLHADDTILVANKPAGLLTDTATRAQQRTRNSLRKQLRERYRAQVWPVHRIDRDTTGVVAFARSEAIRDELREQWHARTPERAYLLIVERRVEGDSGRWADWMAWDAKSRIQRACRPNAEHAVLAEADWSVVKRGKLTTALEVRLVSGRRNQIRLQAMLRGHCLIGEQQYNEGASGRPAASRQLLHAHRLTFDHPLTGVRMRFEAPLPADMATALERMRPPAGG
ncbi:MAG: 23S rRNA pseudouridine1911/1915/1917 synthase [Myxococcota bacterium]|jgi:23S rRNA pseudouridine1911/1915/1917 synthase